MRPAVPILLACLAAARAGATLERQAAPRVPPPAVASRNTAAPSIAALRGRSAPAWERAPVRKPQPRPAEARHGLGLDPLRTSPRCSAFAGECPRPATVVDSFREVANRNFALRAVGRLWGPHAEDVARAWAEGEFRLRFRRGGVDLSLRGKALDFVARAAGEDGAWSGGWFRLVAHEERIFLQVSGVF